MGLLVLNWDFRFVITFDVISVVISDVFMILTIIYMIIMYVTVMINIDDTII